MSSKLIFLFVVSNVLIIKICKSNISEPAPTHSWTFTPAPSVMWSLLLYYKDLDEPYRKYVLCGRNLMEYATYYEKAMLAVPDNERLINSKNYLQESIKFLRNAKLYLREVNLSPLVENVTGLTEKEICNSPRLQTWVFILNYIITKTTSDEITHDGLIELKNWVTRNDTLWKGDYIRFSYYISVAYDMACDVVQLYRNLDESMIRAPNDLNPESIYRMEFLDRPATLKVIVEECNTYLFEGVRQKLSILMKSRYTPVP